MVHRAGAPGPDRAYHALRHDHRVLHPGPDSAQPSRRGSPRGATGNLWFTEQASPGRIGRITPTGTITEFSTGLTSDSKPTGIAAGADGNLWFTEQASPARIGRITPEGTITEFSTGLTANSQPRGSRPDRTATCGSPSSPTPAASGGSPRGGDHPVRNGAADEHQAQGITAANDGNVYFTEFNNPGRSARSRPRGRSRDETPTNSSQPLGIGTGPNGNLWFTEWRQRRQDRHDDGRAERRRGHSSNVAEQTATSTRPSAQFASDRIPLPVRADQRIRLQTSRLRQAAAPAGRRLRESAGLAPTTSYHFRARGDERQRHDLRPGSDLHDGFSAHREDAEAATGTTLIGGTLPGSIDPQAQATTYHFDWGATTAYGSQAPLADASVGSDKQRTRRRTDPQRTHAGHRLPLSRRREQLRRLRGRNHLRAG